MARSISRIIETLEDYGIVPGEVFENADLPETTLGEFPDVGEIGEEETVYSTSIKAVFGARDERQISISDPDDPRIGEWQSEIRDIRERRLGQRDVKLPQEPLEPHCAWYCPIHFFGHGGGIYIREDCILSIGKLIAHFVDWGNVSSSQSSVFRQLQLSAFYVLFLHEQFHHKVESLGFRLLIATDTDRYRPYKKNVYQKSYMTRDCLEESLANAESYRRLSEGRYKKSVEEKVIRDGVRRYLKLAFKYQPPGYKQAGRFLSEKSYNDGLNKLQSQIRDGALNTKKADKHWFVAPQMIRALAKITDEIWVILPSGAPQPIFKTTSVSPGYTVSSRKLITALQTHHGYSQVPGGKGSHVKLKKPGRQTIHVPGNEKTLSPGVVRQALKAIGEYPISRLPDLLGGRLH